MKKYTHIISVALIVFFGIVFNFAVNAYSGSGAQNVFENANIYVGGGSEMGGLVTPYAPDFPNGITVNGTAVVDSSGNWDGAVTGTTGTFSSTLGVTGATTLSSTLGVTGASTLTGALAANGGITMDTSAFVVNDTTGKVGIGDATPDAMVEVVSDLSSDLLNLSSTAAGNGDYLTVEVDGDAIFGGEITSTKTDDIGWTTQITTNTACNSVCTFAAVLGWAKDAGDNAYVPVDPNDATADICLCAGAN